MELSHVINRNKKLAFAVLTVSDTRNVSNDRSGWAIRQKLEDAGHEILSYWLCQDDKLEIETIIEDWLGNPNIQAIITTGGTGVSRRDITLEALTPYFTKTLDGFGELFRFLSYTEDVGSKALLSRAAAGIANDKVVFALPGSVKAVQLAMDKLILREVHHIIYELEKHLAE